MRKRKELTLSIWCYRLMKESEVFTLNKRDIFSFPGGYGVVYNDNKCALLLKGADGKKPRSYEKGKIPDGAVRITDKNTLPSDVKAAVEAVIMVTR